ncbi:phosphotransferase [Microbacterium sp. Root166]|uniref:phosphotransferase n=1 Tax=Microbacterium sp. Root166 TaxID=1736478 RepID=UPI00138F19FD|nr:phosphotransferase [Microbacterium sp. Root166]
MRKTFVSWDDAEADREWKCLSLLATHAPGIAPRPISREFDGDAPVVVMERLVGDPLPLEPATDEQIEALGRTLRRVYAVPLAWIKEAGLPERRFGPTVIADALRDAVARPSDLRECVDPDLVRRAIDGASAHLATSDAVPLPRLTAMGIADLNPANVLWDGTNCRLVDFEDGGLTEPAFELADHVEHIASRMASVYDPQGLVAAVGLSGEETNRFEDYRLLWAIFWLTMLLPGNGAFARNPRGTIEAQADHVQELLIYRERDRTVTGPAARNNRSGN